MAVTGECSSDWAGISTLPTPPFSPAFPFLPHVPVFSSHSSRSSFLQHRILFSHSVCSTLQYNMSRKQECSRLPSPASASVWVATVQIVAYSKVLTAEISPWLVFHILILHLWLVSLINISQMQSVITVSYISVLFPQQDEEFPLERQKLVSHHLVLYATHCLVWVQ